jgi:hypothetical protein
MDNKPQIDLDNLTKEDFIEMAKYCHHLELQLQDLKAHAIAIVGQRNILQAKLDNIQSSVQISTVPIVTTINIDEDLINPEQYRIKK